MIQLIEWFAKTFDCWVWKCEQCGKENIIQGELTSGKSEFQIQVLPIKEDNR